MNIISHIGNNDTEKLRYKTIQDLTHSGQCMQCMYAEHLVNGVPLVSIHNADSLFTTYSTFDDSSIITD